MKYFKRNNAIKVMVFDYIRLNFNRILFIKEEKGSFKGIGLFLFIDWLLLLLIWSFICFVQCFNGRRWWWWVAPNKGIDGNDKILIRIDEVIHIRFKLISLSLLYILYTDTLSVFNVCFGSRMKINDRPTKHQKLTRTQKIYFIYVALLLWYLFCV